MISVNNLINICFQKCSLVGDGQAATGTQAIAALNDLHSVIAELNSQNLMLSDVEVADTFCNGRIKVMQEIPEGWHEVDAFPVLLDDYDVGDLIKCKDEVKYVGFELMSKVLLPLGYDPWPNLVISPLPDRVVTLSRKLGERYVQLFPAERQVLDAKTKQGLPTFYTCETQLEKVKAQDREYIFETFIIETDSVQPLRYRLTYLKSIPHYELTDRLYFSEKLISIIEDGLCAKLCLRYKLVDIKPMFDEEFANGVRLLKRVNQSNRPMTYEGMGGSYLDSYFNGFAPREW